MDYSEIYQSVEGSIVNVAQYDDNIVIQSSGTGVVIDDGRKVLTCHHCCVSLLYKGI